MFKPEKLYALIKQKELSNKEFFDKVKISPQAWRNTCSGGDIGIRKVERIADYFGLSIEYFFDRDQSGSVGHNVNGILNNVSGNIITGRYETEISYLKQLVEEKERTIQLLLNSKNAVQKQTGDQ